MISYIITFIILGTGSIHESLAAIIVARSLTGVAVGLVMPAAQIYVSECSAPQVRGILGSFPAMFMAFGISVTYFAGALLPWDVLSYLCTIVPCLGMITTFIIPESPVWLKSKGKTIEALNSAMWLNNESLIDTIKNGDSKESVGTVDTNVSDAEKTGGK